MVDVLISITHFEAYVNSTDMCYIYVHSYLNGGPDSKINNYNNGTYHIHLILPVLILVM